MSSEPVAPTSLNAANDAVHQHLLDAYEVCLEALTDLALERAAAGLAAFDVLLRAHLEVEEAEVSPALRALGEDAEEEARRVEGDHWILTRCVGAVRRSIDGLRSAERPRRTLVQSLGVLNRLREVLEHHTVREQTRVYPRLDAELALDTRIALARRLAEALPRSDASPAAAADEAPR